jgi:penicillin G amidase
METAVRPQTGRKRWKRAIWNTFLVIVLVTLGIVMFKNAYINRSLPQTKGELSVPGLLAEVKVVRDENGFRTLPRKMSMIYFLPKVLFRHKIVCFKWI